MDIEKFLYDEADLLDRGDLKAWLELFTEDGRYWMPARPDQDDPETEISLFYDDRLLMSIRALNFGHPLSPMMEHPVRTSHVIGNVRLADWDGETARVTANFHVVALQRKEQTVFAGRYTYELVRAGAGWKIRQKRVDLINCDMPMKNILIYL
ncbi:MAG: aromatic-ring-hydroxylating dioxygenase subunit beta [Alphaproteobacteria bacterium]|nr:MAG: aromatic-ring-hydroxylating dioxygenase subunit beta [Alphaproteobacteria bacterium]